MTISIPLKKLQSGFELPIYGMGLWRYSYLQGIDSTEDKPEIEAIEKAIELGVTHFDTAEAYGNGYSESLFGNILKTSDREKLFVASKVSGSNQSYSSLKTSLEQSLERLQTDYLDLYILHKFPDVGIDIQETMKALDEMVEQGLIRHIGASNVTPNRFNQLQQLTDNKIVCNQVHYNVQYREAVEEGVVEHCQTNDVLLVAWRPLQYGELLASDLIKQIAIKYDKTPPQIALNWLTIQKNVAVLCKTNNISHLQQNLNSFDWELSTEDSERIIKEFPDQKFKSSSVPLDYPADTPM